MNTKKKLISPKKSRLCIKMMIMSATPQFLQFVWWLIGPEWSRKPYVWHPGSTRMVSFSLCLLIWLPSRSVTWVSLNNEAVQWNPACRWITGSHHKLTLERGRWPPADPLRSPALRVSTSDYLARIWEFSHFSCWAERSWKLWINTFPSVNISISTSLSVLFKLF